MFVLHIEHARCRHVIVAIVRCVIAHAHAKLHGQHFFEKTVEVVQIGIKRKIGQRQHLSIAGELIDQLVVEMDAPRTQIGRNIGGYHLHIAVELSRLCIVVKIDEIGNVLELHAHRNVARGKRYAPFDIETQFVVEIILPPKMIRQLVLLQMVARFVVESAARLDGHGVFGRYREYAAHAAIHREIANFWSNDIDIAIDIEG